MALALDESEEFISLLAEEEYEGSKVDSVDIDGSERAAISGERPLRLRRGKQLV
jgi:hypothetical protein